jgi:murein DD-endopeptidase MepM/ murein hydrolase activator NlpD
VKTSMKYRITSKFKEMENFRDHQHLGIDFAMPDGTQLRSINDGIIEKIVDYGSNSTGKTIFVKWEDGKVAIYGHLSKFNQNVHEGDSVNVGDVIGYSGNSGHVIGQNGGYHLHFGLKENGKYLDPSQYADLIQNMNTPGYLVSKAEIIEQSMQKTFQLNDFMQMNSDVLNKIVEYLQFKFIYGLSHIVDIIAVVLNMI